MTVTEKPRILVLTSSTGGGHDARASAFLSWVEKLHNGRVEVKIEQLLENASVITLLGVHIYNWIQQKAPALHHLYWWIVELFGFISEHFFLLGASYYKRILRQFRPHLILSLHDSTNRGYFRVAKRVAAIEGVPCVTYCGEFSGGYGFSRNWVTSQADLFLARTKEALQHANKLGIREGKSRIFTNLLAPETFDAVLSPDERRLFRENHLGLSAEKFTVLLATGKAGFNNHRQFLNILAKYPQKSQAIAICGNNRSAHQQLTAWKEANPHYSLFLEGYSENFHQLVQSCDAMITRGGANTATEALFFSCPLIFDTMRGLMPQERLALNYFSTHGAAAVVQSAENFHNLLQDWMEFSESYQAVKDRMVDLRASDNPADFVHEIVSMAQQRASSS